MRRRALRPAPLRRLPRLPEPTRLSALPRRTRSLTEARRPTPPSEGAPARIPLSRPFIDEVDRRAVLEVLQGSTLALGPRAQELEERFSSRLGASCVLVSSGTAALFLALRALGVRGGRVLTPSYGFVATAHAISLAGATPHFVDVDPRHGCITPETLEEAGAGEVSAVLPVHVFGTPAPVVEIRDWAVSRGVPLIEDACEALGTLCAGLPAGTIGDAGTLAFYPNKQMTMGEGGLVILRDPGVAERVRRLRNQGRTPGVMTFEGEGFNFRITEMQAALGLAQLSRVDEWNARRSALAAEYREAFAAMPGVETWAPISPDRRRAGDQRSWFTFPIFLKDTATRDLVSARLATLGIETAPYFPAIDRIDPYRRSPRSPESLPVTTSLSGRGLALPFHAGLTVEERRSVVEAVGRALHPV